MKPQILETAAGPSFFVPYSPALKKMFGSEKTAIIVAYLEYCFSIFGQDFHEFFGPCNHPLYREGNSWLEKLGFTRRVAHKALRPVAARYVTKRDFEIAEDKFRGKLFAYYYNYRTGLYHLSRNDLVADRLLGPIFGKSSVKSKTSYGRKSESLQTPAVQNIDHFEKHSVWASLVSNNQAEEGDRYQSQAHKRNQ